MLPGFVRMSESHPPPEDDCGDRVRVRQALQGLVRVTFVRMYRLICRSFAGQRLHGFTRRAHYDLCSNECAVVVLPAPAKRDIDVIIWRYAVRAFFG